MELSTPADAASLPWPGDELAFRVAGGTDREHFYASGQQSVRDLEAMLALVGTSLRDYRSMLDFGCGCGRIMLWLEELAAGRTLHGVDIDERAIAWAQQHLPWATFKVNQPLPPLDYPDHTFDLVFNHSVFTHIDEEYQDQWLAELRRVTKPGGHLLLSVHGDTAFRAFEDGMRAAGRDPGPVREELARAGIVHVRDDNFVGGPFPDFYHSTFHAPWYVHAHWGRYFTVAGYAARRSLGFQDLVLLERGPETAIAPASPVRRSEPSAADPAGLGDVRARLDAGPDVGSPARNRRVAVPARRLVLRVLRHYTDYQRGVDEALLRAVQRLDPDPSARDNQLWQALRLQGERINRLEADLWDAIRKGDQRA
jgi:SAM-dependent methyltransferase